LIDQGLDHPHIRHKSATMTLDLYGHLYGDRLDEVADAMDAARAAADFLRTNGSVVDLVTRKEASESP
jgi:hypothetical protein